MDTPRSEIDEYLVRAAEARRKLRRATRKLAALGEQLPATTQPVDLDDPALVYGGIALAMFGEPRETRDAHLAVAGTSAAMGEAALAAIGVTVVIAFEDVRFGGVTVSRLSLLGGGKLNTVDLVTPRSSRYAIGLMQRALTGTLDGQTLRVVTPEDFVLLKILSTRDRDLEDARTVIAALHDRLDVDLVQREALALAAEIPDHDVAGRFRAAST